MTRVCSVSLRLACLLLTVMPALLAQSATSRDLFDKAPPDIEEAIRKRATGFYQAHVTGKFREADQYVAEDSKDVFFAAIKQRYRGFEIVRINVSEDLKKAQVLTAVDTDFVMPFGGSRIPVKAPITTLWKFENGDWWWYVPEDSGTMTPFGKMTPGPDVPQTLPTPLPVGREIDALANQVKISRTSVTLSTAAPNVEEITITNNMPGSISLDMYAPTMIDVVIKLDKKELAAGESAKLTVEWTSSAGGERGAFPIRLDVLPINITYNIEVKFTPAPPAPAAKSVARQP